MLDRVTTPLDAPEPHGATVRLSTVRHRAALRLRSWLPAQRSAEPIVLVGRQLPRRVGDTVRGPTRVLCLAPDEWLILSDQPTAELQSGLRPELLHHGLALADWSDGLIGLAADGTAARTLLSKACGLDLDLHAFPPGRCARTRFAQLPVVLDCVDDCRFELFVARSYFSYLHDWLIDAATETGRSTSA